MHVRSVTPNSIARFFDREGRGERGGIDRRNFPVLFSSFERRVSTNVVQTLLQRGLPFRFRFNGANCSRRPGEREVLFRGEDWRTFISPNQTVGFYSFVDIVTVLEWNLSSVYLIVHIKM